MSLRLRTGQHARWPAIFFPNALLEAFARPSNELRKSSYGTGGQMTFPVAAHSTAHLFAACAVRGNLLPFNHFGVMRTGWHASRKLMPHRRRRNSNGHAHGASAQGLEIMMAAAMRSRL